MTEKLGIPSKSEAREADDQSDIEGAGLKLIGEFANEKQDISSASGQEIFDARIEMAREEVRRIGGSLQRFQGKGAYMIGMTMLGLSLSWGMSHGAESAQLQVAGIAEGTQEGASAVRYEKAQEVLAKVGISISPERGIAKDDLDRLHREALLRAINDFASQVRRQGIEVDLQGSRLSVADKSVSPAFEAEVLKLESQLHTAEDLLQALRSFFPKAIYDEIRPMYEPAKENLRAAKVLIEKSKHPTEEQKELYKLREMIDTLEEKQKKTGILDSKDQQSLGELRGRSGAIHTKRLQEELKKYQTSREKVKIGIEEQLHLPAEEKR